MRIKNTVIKNISLMCLASLGILLLFAILWQNNNDQSSDLIGGSSLDSQTLEDVQIVSFSGNSVLLLSPFDTSLNDYVLRKSGTQRLHWFGRIDLKAGQTTTLPLKEGYISKKKENDIQLINLNQGIIDAKRDY